MVKQSVHEIVVSKNNFYSEEFLKKIKHKELVVKNKSKEVVLKKYLLIAQKVGKIGNWGINFSTQKTYLNKSASDILEISNNRQLSLQEFTLLIHPNDLNRVLVVWKKLCKGEIVQIIFRLCVNNKMKWIKIISSHQWKNENGEIQTVGSVQDITEIKEKQLELEFKKKELDFIVKNIPVTITQLSPNFKVIFSNYEHEESGGVDFFNHIAPEFQQSLRNKFTEARQTGKSVSIELKGVGRFLTLKWFRLVINKVEGINKDFEYTYFVIGKDISKEKQFQEELIRATTESEEKERKRIALELHDGVCQNLVALKMLAMKFAKENIELEQNIQKNNSFSEIKNLIECTLSDIRRCSYDLMPINLEIEGLYGALKTLFAINNTVTSIRHTLEINAITLPNNFIAINVYRIVQEFIQNSQKHSACTDLLLRISENKHRLIFCLSDNGKGFPQTEDHKTGIGTLSMLARIKNIGGTYNVITNSGNGVQLYFSISIE